MILKQSICALVILLLSLLGEEASYGQLRIDFNDRSSDLPADTHEDFDAFVLSANGGSTALQTNTVTLRFGTITISVSNNSGNGLDDRKRTYPTNTASFTEEQLLRDFIFNSGATTVNSGLSVRVQGLTPNQSNQFTIWSFDSNSQGNRVSDWYANGVLVKSGYAFNGAVRPTNNTTCRFSFSATANTNGEVLIDGRRNSSSVDENNAAATGVFLNALQIDSIPDQSPPCGTGEHFKAGSNLYGWTGGATFAEQDQEVAMLKAAGAQWARINAVWFAVEPQQKGSYDTNLLSLYDHLMQRLGENGIKAIFVTADTPYWASSDPAKTNGVWNSRYKPSSASDLADYLVFLANRYRSTGPHAFEIWNEENETYFWPNGASAPDYLPLLSTCYTALKTADPQAIVLNGGLSDSSSVSNYAASLYASGGKNYFDAWAQHVYPRTPQYETVVQKVRDIMVANGDAQKKIWISETGWPTYTNAADPSAVSSPRQAHYFTNLFTRLAAYAFVETGVWYTSRSYDETQKEGSFGLLLPDFTPKPCYNAFKDWTLIANRHCFPWFINLSPPQITSDGVVHVQFNADSGFIYTVQTSNLGNWSALITNVTSTNDSFSFNSPSASNCPSAFYRVKW